MKILITGDDGYNSTGIKLLIKLLKNENDLTIIATKEEQSGMGGGITVKETTWKETEVDGIKAFYVDGKPAEAMEFAHGYFGSNSFDLVISGMNLGENVGYMLNSSGTFGAIFRAVALNIASHTISVSYMVKKADLKLDDNFDISIGDMNKLLMYPGGMIKETIDLCIQQNYWDKPFVNINLPFNPTDKVKITKLQTDITKYYKYPVIIDKEKQTYKYPDQEYEEVDLSTADMSIDSNALLGGYISISPISFE